MVTAGVCAKSGSGAKTARTATNGHRRPRVETPPTRIGRTDISFPLLMRARAPAVDLPPATSPHSSSGHRLGDRENAGADAHAWNRRRRNTCSVRKSARQDPSQHPRKQAESLTAKAVHIAANRQQTCRFLLSRPALLCRRAKGTRPASTITRARTPVPV